MVNYSKPDIGVFRRDTKIHWDTANELRMLYLQNRSGQSVTTGDVVVWDTANPNSFKLTTTEGDVSVCGVIAQALDEKGNATTQTIANLEWGWVQTRQRCPKVKLSTTASVGDFIQTSTTAGLGKSSADAEPGSFAIALTSGTEVECLLGFISPSAIGLNIKDGLLYTDLTNNRVAVGTLKPSYKVHSVMTSAGTTTYPIALDNQGTTANTGVGLRFLGRDTNNVEIEYADIRVIFTNTTAGTVSSNMCFFTRHNQSFVQHVTIQSDGSVGFGTPKPEQRLHAIGHLKLELAGARIFLEDTRTGKVTEIINDD